MIQRRELRISLTRTGFTLTELLGVSMCTVFFAGWLAAVTGGVSVRSTLSLAAVMASYWVAGTIATGLLSLGATWRRDLPMKVLLGCCIINASLFILALASPFSILTNFCLVMLATIGLLPAIPPGSWSVEPKVSSRIDVAALAWLFICLLGTTLWARDSLNPIIHASGAVWITSWADSYIHAGFIRMLAEAHGMDSLQSPLLAGAPAPIYHYASYMAPALLTATAGLNAFDVFNGFVAPGGLFMSCLAAYVLMRALWKTWPAYAASLSLLLLPNASFHGLTIPWFSYHWLTLISPSLAYGLAIFGLAWALMFEGLRENRFVLIVASFFVVCLSALFKVYFLVSFSFMALIYPLMFRRGLSSRLRWAGLLAAVFLFWVGLQASGHFKAAPLLQLDFSAARRYGELVISQVENGYFQAGILGLRGAVPWLQGPLDALVIYWGTFGFFGLACPVAAFMLRRKADRSVLCFPLLTMGFYMIFSVGLAFDGRLGSSQEHFLHRHFVWAYLVACSWTAGALYWDRFGDAPPGRPFPRWIMATAVAVCLVFSYFWGHQVQRGPLWGKSCSWLTVPTGFVQSCYFIRDHSRGGDIVQDSNNDPQCMATALCGRQAYVIDYWLLHETLPPQALERIQELRRFKDLTSQEEIAHFATSRGIRWYILHPDDSVHWPPEAVNGFAFEDKGFRVYAFQEGKELAGGKDVE